MHRAAPADEGLPKLQTFLRRAVIAAGGCAAIYLLVGGVLGSPMLIGTGATVVLYTGVCIGAALLARRGDVQVPALLVAHGLLVTIVIVTPLVPFAYATLVALCLLAIAVALPYASPRRIRQVALGALLVTIYVLVVGVWRSPAIELPSYARDLVVAPTLLVAVYLVTYLVVQLHQRLRATLEAERAAARRLEDAFEVARDAERRKDEFLAVLGHELRNPLAPISTALELMDSSPDAPNARERAVIDRQVRHMARLVDDLLDVSRITRGKLELRRTHVEVGDVVEEALESVGPLLDERSVEVDVPRSGLPVSGDPARLAQVVRNLLSNAVKYTPRDGRVLVRGERRDGEVRLEVRDDGVGMAPEQLSHVFEPFVQGARRMDRARGGLGLGLALARSLVERHGGRIEATSEGIGRGSSFVVILPASEGPASGESVVRPAAAMNGGHGRVLVVDDNEDAADLVARALTRRGYDVRVAYDGPQALRVASDFHPEAAVLDIGLPVMDGYELADRLRGELDRPVRIVAVTGYGQQRDRERSQDAGFAAHLVKPVDLAQLEQSLR